MSAAARLVSAGGHQVRVGLSSMLSPSLVGAHMGNDGNTINRAAVTAPPPPAPPPGRGRLELVDDWRDAWRWWSLRLWAVAVFFSAWPEAFLALYALVPVDLQYLLPGRTAVVVACMLLGFAARVIKQRRPARTEADHG